METSSSNENEPKALGTKYFLGKNLQLVAVLILLFLKRDKKLLWTGIR